MPFTELDFTHTATAFLVLLIGIILSTVILIVEKIRKKITLSKHKFPCALQVKVRIRQSMTQRYGVNTDDIAASSSALVKRFTSVDPSTRSLENKTWAQARVSH